MREEEGIVERARRKWICKRSRRELQREWTGLEGDGWGNGRWKGRER